MFKSFIRALCYLGFLNNMFIKLDKSILDFWIKQIVKGAGLSTFSTTYSKLGMQCLRLIPPGVPGLKKSKRAHFREGVKVRAEAATSGNTIQGWKKKILGKVVSVFPPLFFHSNTLLASTTADWSHHFKKNNNVLGLLKIF